MIIFSLRRQSCCDSVGSFFMFAPLPAWNACSLGSSDVFLLWCRIVLRGVFIPFRESQGLAQGLLLTGYSPSQNQKNIFLLKVPSLQWFFQLNLHFLLFFIPQVPCQPPLCHPHADHDVCWVGLLALADQPVLLHKQPETTRRPPTLTQARASTSSCAGGGEGSRPPHGQTAFKTMIPSGTIVIQVSGNFGFSCFVFLSYWVDTCSHKIF